MKKKYFMFSKTFIGLLTMLAPVILQLFGVDIMPQLSDGKVTIGEWVEIAGMVLTVLGLRTSQTILTFNPREHGIKVNGD